jgi:hypothetical protein
MWVRISDWIATTDGMAIGMALDLALAVVSAAVATTAVRLLIESL